MRSLILTALVCAFTSAATSAPLPAATRSEIGALLNRLESSGCRFNRNGSWHAAAEAKQHLLRKLDYLEGKNAVTSTERFIELGASSSSSSGKPYLVQCGTAPAVESAKWLRTELNELRKSGPAASRAE
ncbi:DUF5329 domain-containing protein [Caldimonas brevitalea]|uniref:Secreted protein n=1 Tax=Caldimonas brevitalea TaxID=413882 RepID=A0A0G3BRD3_9BURK|nr:DUF5329 domain-containing protein [Caldimonas brevitalea]AKJ29110.1 hypothetical protein AAW51_2419 [Caldimonas brevitalea]